MRMAASPYSFLQRPAALTRGNVTAEVTAVIEEESPAAEEAKPKRKAAKKRAAPAKGAKTSRSAKSSKAKN